MKMTLAATCPYCSKHTSGTVKVSLSRNRHIYLCDPDSGGCDKLFVVFWHIQVRTEAKKIDGQEEPHQLKSVK
jgi:hypothetical protein